MKSLSSRSPVYLTRPPAIASGVSGRNRILRKGPPLPVLAWAILSSGPPRAAREAKRSLPWGSGPARGIARTAPGLTIGSVDPHRGLALDREIPF